VLKGSGLGSCLGLVLVGLDVVRGWKIAPVVYICQTLDLDLDLDNSCQEPEAITAMSGCTLWKSGEPTLEGGRYCVGLSN